MYVDMYLCVNMCLFVYVCLLCMHLPDSDCGSSSVCMCTCMCACMHVCTFMKTQSYTHMPFSSNFSRLCVFSSCLAVFVYVHLRVCTQVCMYIFSLLRLRTQYINTRIHMNNEAHHFFLRHNAACMCEHVYVCIHIYVYVWIYVCIHTYIHA
jgi:hypothetical protein